jgi:hypothetical protein
MKVYLATNETPKEWMLHPNDDNVNSPIESKKRISELESLNAVFFVWTKGKFLPLKSYTKGQKPKLQNYSFVIKWEI